MPRVVTTRGAIAGLQRCRRFLDDKAPEAGPRAAQIIADRFQALQAYPDIGRPLADRPELRELVIPFGEAGYVALYRYEPADETVYILAFRHQKEAGDG